MIVRLPRTERQLRCDPVGCAKVDFVRIAALREIRVRVALDAHAQIVAIVIRDARWPIVFGLVAGLVRTYYGTPSSQSFCFRQPT